MVWFPQVEGFILLTTNFFLKVSPTYAGRMYTAAKMPSSMIGASSSTWDMAVVWKSTNEYGRILSLKLRLSAYGCEVFILSCWKKHDCHIVSQPSPIVNSYGFSMSCPTRNLRNNSGAPPRVCCPMTVPRMPRRVSLNRGDLVGKTWLERCLKHDRGAPRARLNSRFEVMVWEDRREIGENIGESLQETRYR